MPRVSHRSRPLIAELTTACRDAIRLLDLAQSMLYDDKTSNRMVAGMVSLRAVIVKAERHLGTVT